jgi:hypothetical protein
MNIDNIIHRYSLLCPKCGHILFFSTKGEIKLLNDKRDTVKISKIKEEKCQTLITREIPVM